MARSKRNSGSPADSERPNDRAGRFTQSTVRWINPYLDKGDVSWLDSHDSELPIFVCDFVDAIPETANLSVKYDDRSGRYNAVIIYSADDPTNPGIAVSCRAATRIDALFALAYVVGEKYKWQLPAADQDQPGGRWG